MDAKKYMWQMGLERYEIFIAQDPDNFDVTFEVDGKKIYANKYVLDTISTTFHAMLSQRWKSKDEVIKVETYSYDNFYQFLNFVYSGNCNLTDENISTMVDMAEFYNVSTLKDFCDVFISNMDYTVEMFFDIIDLATKYSLPKTKAAINTFTRRNLSNILESDRFMTLEKSSIESFVSLKRDAHNEERLFEAVYKWAENRIEGDGNVTDKKEKIKAELSTILPHINLKRMNPGYFSKYVVSRGYLFTDKQLSATLCDHHKITVGVMDMHGQCLTGSFTDTFNVFDVIKDHENKLSNGQWLCRFKPSTPSDKKKKENVRFYFVLTDDQHLKVKKSADITDNDYLLCEMKGDTKGLSHKVANNYPFYLFATLPLFRGKSSFVGTKKEKKKVANK